MLELEVMGLCERRTEGSQPDGCSFLKDEKLGPALGEEGGAPGRGGGGGRGWFALPWAQCLPLLPLGAGR